MILIRSVVAATIVSACALLSASCFAATVSTLSGSGSAGIADGDASHASFIAPVALAYDSTGKLYVSDEAAQRIRVILPDGRVQTAAGSGAVLPSGLWVDPGYADGPAAAARFNRPMGLAVGPQDDVYVADTGNHCIRRISTGGVVTTVAGSPNRPGGQDGPVASASLMYPTGVAVDGKGNLYVTDPASGLRFVSAQGTVSTLRLPIRIPLSVSIWRGGDGALFVTAADGLWKIDLSSFARNSASAVTHLRSGGWQYPPPPAVEGINQFVVRGQMPVGYPFGIAAFDEGSAVYTDPATHTVRYADLQVGEIDPIGGQAVDDAARDGGGFADGSTGASRFDAPTGVAVRADGVVAIADTGNKRIRTITAIDRSKPYYAINGLIPGRTNNSEYRIGLLGNSFIWGDGVYDDSVAGRIEARLKADKALNASGNAPRVVPIWMGSQFKELLSYLDAVAETHLVDAVVIQLNDFVLESYGTGPWRDRIVADAPSWQPRLAADLASARAACAKAGIPVLFVLHPLDNDEGIAEGTLTKALADQPMGFAVGQASDGVVERLFLASFARARIVPLNGWDLFEADLRSPAHRPIYLSIDGHFTDYGKALLGNAIASELEVEKPWSKREPPPR